MSTTFVVSLLVALLAVVYWRAVMMIAIVVLLALLLTGIGTITSVLHDAEGERSSVVAPGTSEPPPAGAAAHPTGGGPSGPGARPNVEQPPG